MEGKKSSWTILGFGERTPGNKYETTGFLLGPCS